MGTNAIPGERILTTRTMCKEIDIQSMQIRKQQAKSEQVLPGGFLYVQNSPLCCWCNCNKGAPAYNVIGLLTLDCQSGLYLQ